MFKGFYGLLNERLMKLCTYNKRNTRQKMNFYVNYKRTKLKTFSISCHGVSLWNSLNIEIRSSKSINMFKKRMKKYLLTGYTAL